jgi:hypothetical protein
MDTQTILFLHLQKTAGGTLRSILARNFSPDSIYTITDRPDIAFQKLKALTATERARIRLLRGHMDFGWHDLFAGPTFYFTLLREPVERVISHYYFMGTRVNHPFYEDIRSGRRSLKYYLENKVGAEFSNLQTRWLAGAWGRYELDTNDLETAKKNLRDYFTVVGLTEKFDETLLLLQKQFGWRDIYYQKRHNVNKNRPDRHTVTPDTLQAIIEHNQWDIKLYQYAQVLFARQVKQYGPFFPLKVGRYKVMNRAQYWYWQLRKYSIRVFMRTALNRLQDREA